MDPDARVGPYCIDGRLGRGGMGVVYRARHAASGREVALKTVDVADAALLSSIRREIQALSRLAHPGIVRILDQGVADGLPWYAMELLEGVTLEALVPGPAGGEPLAAGDGEAWWTGSLAALRPTERQLPVARLDVRGAPAVSRGSRRPAAAGGELRRALSLVRRLCAPLSYLHGEGLVHRDLKPANVLVRPDGMPVLIDFGLMTQFGGEEARESLELDADAVGTVAYVAPEQGQGDLVDARADLYALGCILYELLTGQPPFTGPSPLDVLTRRYQEAPAPPSRLVKDVPGALDELVVRLLARDPRARIGHADDVAGMLARLGAEDGLASMGPRPRPYLYRPALAGRRAEVTAVVDRLAKLYGGAGELVLVGGESGVGKTRFVMEVAARAFDQRFDVLLGECPPPGEGGDGRGALTALLKPLRAVADRCRERGREYVEAVLGPGGHRGRLLSRYVAALGALPGVADCPEPSELAPEAARTRLWSYLAATLAALCADRPVVLVLDDLQWADDLTTGFLRFLVDGDHLAAMPLLILATHRSEEPSPEVERLRGVGRSSEIEIERLATPVVGEMVADMLALPAAPPPFVAFLAEASEGNPFFIAEYLRTAVAEGLLERTPAGRWQIAGDGGDGTGYRRLPLPRHVRDLVGRRLSGLGAGARSLARMLAVFGREADLEMVVLAEGAGEGASMDAWNELHARQVVDEVAPGHVRFLHDKLREVCYEDLAVPERVRRHAAAAAVLDALPSSEREEQLASLGRHHELAGDVARARSCYLPAARREVARHALGEAERLYRAYLALSPGADGDVVDARNELGGRVLGHAGRDEAAILEHRQALAECRALGDRRREVETLRLMGIASSHLSRAADALGLYEEAAALARSLGERRLEGLILNNMGSTYITLGQPDAARAQLEEALTIQRAIGHRSKEALTLGNLAVTQDHQGRSDLARPLYEQALAIHRELGRKPEEGQVLANLASLHTNAGQFEEAQRLYEESLAIHRADGNRRFEAFLLANLASLHADAGRYDQSLAAYEQAERMARELGDRRFRAMLECNHASLLYELGRVAEARDASALALELARAVGERRVESAALCNLALCHTQLGEIERARRDYDAALAAARRVGDRHMEGQVLYNRGGLELRAGDPATARRRLVGGLKLLRAAGDARLEVAALTTLARLERRSGRLLAAVRRLNRARSAVAPDDLPNRLRLCCEEGHLALARGRDGRQQLGRADRLAVGIVAGADATLHADVEALRGAVDALALGQPLLHGELADREDG